MKSEPFSLYIHIPYCISKCPYCDFNSHVVAEIPEAHYTDALLRELEYYGEADDWRGRNVQSIFFGGGTPSTFKPASIGRILALGCGDCSRSTSTAKSLWKPIRARSMPPIFPATATPVSIASASACNRSNRGC